MKSRTLVPTAVLALCLADLVGSAPLAAQSPEPSTTPVDALDTLTWVLDPDASQVTFTLGATLHTVEGSFQIEKGEIAFDPATGKASGRVVVDAASGDTGNDKRDRDMHVKVLESERYPGFVFTPTRIEGDFQPSGSSEVTLHGVLEIHGGEHEISIPATVAVSPAGEASGEGAAGDGELRLEATGSFVIPYVEWGLEDPSKFILRVKKSVDVTVHAEGRLERRP